MGTTKYPIIDPDFLIKSLGSCEDDEERGLLLIGFLYGLHPSSITKLDPRSIRKEGNKRYLYWVRPKTNKTLRGEINPKTFTIIENHIKKRRKSRQQYDNMIRAVCERAGYENVSIMTLRHMNCIYHLTNREVGLFSVHHLMGCTPEVVGRNYTQALEEIKNGFRYKIPWEM
jgi:hypothetical protein